MKKKVEIKISIAKKVKDKITKMPEGTIFTAKDIKIKDGSISAIEMTLSRLVRIKTIVKIGKGLFSKPKETKFGRLDYSQDMLIKLAEKKTTLINTGHSLFNNLGISTQVPAKQTIKAKKAISVLTTTQKTKFLKVKIDKNIVPHRKSDRHLVEILEALLEIKKISGASSDDVVKKIASLIYSKSKNDAIKLSYLSLAYRPSVRAVLGAIFSLSGSEELLPLAKFIKKSLNPMTKYKLNITNNSLSNHREWNIQ